jgi:hypothetical protein
MNIRKTLTVVGLMLAFAFTPSLLHADEFDQATKFTFSQPVQIPGRILPAGTYWFQLLNTTNRQIVEVQAEDHTPIALLYTFARERSSGNEDVAVTLADRGPNQPEAIVAWFYQGDTSGHQFLYPKQQARELARDMQKTVVAGD